MQHHEPNACNEDLDHVVNDLCASDRGLRTSSAKLICEWANENSINQELLQQKNGLSVGWLQVFSIPTKYQDLYNSACRQNNISPSTNGLKQFLHDVVASLSKDIQLKVMTDICTGKVDTTPLSWHTAIQQHVVYPDPETEIIGIYLSPAAIDRDQFLRVDDEVRILSPIERTALVYIKKVFNTCSHGDVAHVQEILATIQIEKAAGTLPEAFHKHIVNMVFQGLDGGISWYDFSRRCILAFNSYDVCIKISRKMLPTMHKLFCRLVKQNSLGLNQNEDDQIVWSSMLYNLILHNFETNRGSQLHHILENILLARKGDYFDTEHLYPVDIENVMTLTNASLGFAINWFQFVARMRRELLTASQPLLPTGHKKLREMKYVSQAVIRLSMGTTVCSKQQAAAKYFQNRLAGSTVLNHKIEPEKRRHRNSKSITKHRLKQFETDPTPPKGHAPPVSPVKTRRIRSSNHLDQDLLNIKDVKPPLVEDISPNASAVALSYAQLTDQQKALYMYRFSGKALSRRVALEIQKHFIQRTRAEEVNAAFKQYQCMDKYQQRLIKRSDLLAVTNMAGLTSLDPGKVHLMAKQLDKNRNGYITWEDFSTWYHQQVVQTQ